MSDLDPVVTVLGKQIVDLAGRIAGLETRIAELEQRIPKAVELLRPQEGDVILLTVSDNLKTEQRRIIGKEMRHATGIRTVVLPESMAAKMFRSSLSELTMPEEFGRPALEGELKVGDKLIWEPFDNPAAYENVEVAEISGGMILLKCEDGSYWNDESRVREACIRK